MKLRCKKCGYKGISAVKKIMIRKNFNVTCNECNTAYNFPGTVGILLNLFSAALGTMFFYLIFIADSFVGLIGYLLIVFALPAVAMMLMPLNEVDDSLDRHKNG